MAKHNVVQNYLIIGVLEDFVGFLRVLETLLPMHFSRSTQVYDEFLSNTKSKGTGSLGKQKLNEKAISLLKERMKLEYEFYNFVNQIFKDVKRSLKIV